MASVIGSVVLTAADSGRAGAFWTEALGYVSSENNPEFLVPPSSNSGSVELHLDRTDKMHLDLWIDRDTTDLQREADRLVALGARRVDWQYGPGAQHVVLADTEGNLFCVCG